MKAFIERYNVDLTILAGLAVCWAFVGLFLLVL